MKPQEEYALALDDKKQKNKKTKGSSYNTLGIKILLILSIGYIFLLALIRLSPSLVGGAKNINFMNCLIGYTLIIALVLIWNIYRIAQFHYRAKSHSKISLLMELEKSKSINAELRKSNEELKKLAFTDQLTGIPNRRCFINFINSELENNLKRESLLSVIMLDIDFFKQLNEGLGHRGADKLLVSIAKEINSVSKGTKGIAARYGGDEFIIASFNTNEKQIHEIAETIRDRVSKLKIPSGNFKGIGNISISVGTSTVRVTNKEDVFRGIDLADKALFTAKDKGRNCIENITDIRTKQKSSYFEAS